VPDEEARAELPFGARFMRVFGNRDDVLVNVAAARNNLRYAGYDDAQESTGQRWTVRVVRPTDPRWSWAAGNWYTVGFTWRRVVRWLRRDDRWFVEALAAPDTDWRKAVFVAELQNQGAAIERAIQVLRDIERGDPPRRSTDA
jgi:hypothetical protein